MTPKSTEIVSFPKQRPEWLPLHVAQFRFFPEFTATTKSFTQELAHLAARETPDVEVSEVGPFAVQLAFGGAALLVDGENGEFELTSDTDHDIYDLGHWAIRARAINYPRAFDAKMFKESYVLAARKLHELALSIMLFQRRSFDLAVTTGGAELFGRWRDLKSPFEPIYPDQWERFHPIRERGAEPQTDIYLLVGSEWTDEKIYSVHVQGHRKQISSSNRAVIDCEQFLLGRMKASPDRRIKIDDLEIEARKFWPEKQLPHRKFLECYRRAKNQANLAAWQKRGRILNSNQCTD